MRSLLDLIEGEDLLCFSVPKVYPRKNRQPWRGTAILKTHLIPYGHPAFCLTEMDFVGRFERLHQDWAVVCAELGIKEALPHKNRSPHPHYTQFYDRRTQDRVARIYAEDIERFGYTFG